MSDAWEGWFAEMTAEADRLAEGMGAAAKRLALRNDGTIERSEIDSMPARRRFFEIAQRIGSACAVLLVTEGGMWTGEVLPKAPDERYAAKIIMSTVQPDGRCVVEFDKIRDPAELARVAAVAPPPLWWDGISKWESEARLHYPDDGLGWG